MIGAERVWNGGVLHRVWCDNRNLVGRLCGHCASHVIDIKWCIVYHKPQASYRHVYKINRQADLTSHKRCSILVTNKSPCKVQSMAKSLIHKWDHKDSYQIASNHLFLALVLCCCPTYMGCYFPLHDAAHHFSPSTLGMSIHPPGFRLWHCGIS